MKDKAIVETLVPSYLKDFACIGASCEDTCCAGWRVNIDEETYKKYKKVKNKKIKLTLDKNIVRNRSNPTENNAAKMKMNNNKCSFLSDEGWCDIQSDLGENYLCDTCMVYPRINHLINNVIERSLTVSCPEAARLVLNRPEGILFESLQDEMPKRGLIQSIINTNQEDIRHWQDLFGEYRFVTISILQNRMYSLEERLLILGLFYDEIHEKIEKGNLNALPSILGQYLDAVERGIYKNEFNSISKRLDIQLRLSREFVLLRMQSNIASERYLECSREMISGLGIEKDTSDAEVLENYVDANELYYKPFIRNHEYMLENFLANYVFKKYVPIDSVTPFESYSIMVIHYAIIKLHLIGMARYHKGLTPELVIKLIQSISKTYEHNPMLLTNLVKLMKENDFMNLTYMSILINN